MRRPKAKPAATSVAPIEDATAQVDAAASTPESAPELPTADAATTSGEAVNDAMAQVDAAAPAPESAPELPTADAATTSGEAVNDAMAQVSADAATPEDAPELPAAEPATTGGDAVVDALEQVDGSTAAPESAPPPPLEDLVAAAGTPVSPIEPLSSDTTSARVVILLGGSVSPALMAALAVEGVQVVDASGVAEAGQPITSLQLLDLVAEHAPSEVVMSPLIVPDALAQIDDTPPRSELPQPPAPQIIPLIRVSAKAERGRWRAGLKFDQAPRHLTFADLTSEQIGALEVTKVTSEQIDEISEDQELIVEIVDPASLVT